MYNNKKIAIYGAKYAHNPIVIAKNNGYTDIMLIDDINYLIENIPKGTDFISCVGDTYNRYKTYQKAIEYGLKPINLVSKTAQVYSDIGNGNIICQNVVIQPGSTIGTNCYIHTGAVIGPKVNISHNVTINSNCCISAESKINNFSYIGVNSTLLQNSTVGSGATMGASSLVKLNDYLTPMNTYIGIPTRVLRARAFVDSQEKSVARYRERPRNAKELKKWKNFGKEYFDGKSGYGGYKYNENITSKLFEDRIMTMLGISKRDLYNKKLLDVGCAKGFILHYATEKEGASHLSLGIDISSYALNKSIYHNVKKLDASKIDTINDIFDIGYSLGTLYLLPDLSSIEKAIVGMQNKCNECIIEIRTYRDEKEKKNMLMWEPNIQVPMSLESWADLLIRLNYRGKVIFTTTERK